MLIRRQNCILRVNCRVNCWAQTQTTQNVELYSPLLVELCLEHLQSKYKRIIRFTVIIAVKGDKQRLQTADMALYCCNLKSGSLLPRNR